MSVAQTTDAMPTQPSSKRSRSVAAMIITSTRRKMARTKLGHSMPFEGTEKNRMAERSDPAVRVVKEKSKKPDPRECIIGGLMKIDTSRSTHQRKVMMRKRIEI